jgi:secreted PhoX family phosphatase
MATESKDEAANVGRRGFLKVAAVGAATAVGFLAATAFNAKEGVKSAKANLGEDYGEGASLVVACGMDPGHCGEDDGQCGIGMRCSGS